MKVKFVVLDCYGLLFEEKSVFENTFNYIAKTYSFDREIIKSTFESIREVVNRHLKHRAFMSQRQRYSLMFELTATNLKINNFEVEIVADFLMKQFSTVKIYPETLLLINTLKQNYKVVLLANADNDALSELLQNNNLKFDYVITSQSAKAYKPNKRIFQHLINVLNCNREDIVFVGNDLKKDVFGGLDFGICSVWLNRDDSNALNDHEIAHKNVLEIKKLNELLSLLEEVDK